MFIIIYCILYTETPVWVKLKYWPVSDRLQIICKPCMMLSCIQHLLHFCSTWELLSTRKLPCIAQQWVNRAFAFCKHCETAIEAAARAASSYHKAASMKGALWEHLKLQYLCLYLQIVQVKLFISQHKCSYVLVIPQARSFLWVCANGSPLLGSLAPAIGSFHWVQFPRLRHTVGTMVAAGSNLNVLMKPKLISVALLDLGMGPCPNWLQKEPQDLS